MSGPAERGQDDSQGTSEAEPLRLLGGLRRSFAGARSRISYRSTRSEYPPRRSGRSVMRQIEADGTTSIPPVVSEVVLSSKDS